QRIVAPTLTEYIRVDGDNDEWGQNDVPVRGIEVKGLTFKHGKRLVLRKDSRGVQHDWEMFDEGNAYIRLRGAENCLISECTFLNSAGTGIRLDLYSQNNRVEGNKLDNLGYTGILLCGYGPGTKDVNKNNIVTNNEISRVGRLWFHALAIFVFQSGHNTISHNYIHHTSYDAIVVSGVRPRFFGWKFKDFPDFPTAFPDLREIMRIMRWEEIGGKPDTFKGCLDYAHSRGNIIEYNEINSAMGDGGDGNALYLSGTIGNTFRYNIVHSTAAGPGMFRNDDEQYESLFYGNILIGIGNGNYSGTNLKHENAFENNMILNWGSSAVGSVTSLDPLQEKGSKGTRVSRNIIMHPGDNTLFIGKVDVHWGDNNLFYAAGDLSGSKKWLKERQAAGQDRNSVASDPMFEDLENFNFRLKPGSPALKLGFEQIPFERMGLLSKPTVERLRENGRKFSQLLTK
ncbi:MAG: right-handed parallel beta-helix repeat-containing protein, partial [Verrucomicrobia bacterium]|nr:right-handed parallel beta-helix repeat-containing protein [Verrucomicrobiota bacterium]